MKDYNMEKSLTRREGPPNNYTVIANSIFDVNFHPTEVLRVGRFLVNDIHDRSKDIRLGGIISIYDTPQALDFSRALFETMPFLMHNYHSHREAVDFLCISLFKVGEAKYEKLFECWTANRPKLLDALKEIVDLAYKKHPTPYGVQDLRVFVKSNIKVLFARIMAYSLMKKIQQDMDKEFEN